MNVVFSIRSSSSDGDDIYFALPPPIPRVLEQFKCTTSEDKGGLRITKPDPRAQVSQ